MARRSIAACSRRRSRRLPQAMTVEDLATHEADWCGTIAQDFAGSVVHELPPNGQGIATLMALGMLESLDVGARPVDDVETIHLAIEATKLALADLDRFVSDPASMTISPTDLLDPAYLATRAALVDRKRAGDPGHGAPKPGGTVYLTTADASGMMVSFIQSNYNGFGSGVVVPGTGISLQNRGTDFSATPAHPNLVGPRKRPYHTIVPGFLTRDGAPVMSFGVMGGTMQPQGHLQIVARIADHGQNPQAACDGPRFRWLQDMQVSVEDGLPPATVDELRRRGHDLVVVDDYNQFGSCQAIWRLPDGYLAASDPRRDGQTAGF